MMPATRCRWCPHEDIQHAAGGRCDYDDCPGWADSYEPEWVMRDPTQAELAEWGKAWERAHPGVVCPYDGIRVWERVK